MNRMKVDAAPEVGNVVVMKFTTGIIKYMYMPKMAIAATKWTTGNGLISYILLLSFL